MALFADPASVFDDTLLLLHAARALWTLDDPMGRQQLRLYEAVEGAVPGAVALVASGALVPAALELLAGVTGVVRAKDYAMNPFWKSGWTLANDGVSSGPSADPVVRAAERVALAGAGGTVHRRLCDVRPMLWHNRALAPQWEALCAGVDVVGAGSHLGLDRLRALSDANPASPSIAWLWEHAARVAGRAPQAAAAQSRLEALLASGRFGPFAAQSCVAVQLARDADHFDPAAARDAFLLLPGQVVTMPVDSLPIDTPSELARLRRAARAGHEGAQAFLEMKDVFDHALAAAATEEERQGPFYGLWGPPPGHERIVDSAAHWLCMGFRETYGFELLERALPVFELIL